MSFTMNFKCSDCDHEWHTHEIVLGGPPEKCPNCGGSPRMPNGQRVPRRDDFLNIDFFNTRERESRGL